MVSRYLNLRSWSFRCGGKAHAAIRPRENVLNPVERVHHCIMIIQARTKKNRHIGYTARNVLDSGSRVPVKKFIDADGVSSHHRMAVHDSFHGRHDSPHTLHAQQARLIGIRTNRLCTKVEIIDASNIGASA